MYREWILRNKLSAILYFLVVSQAALHPATVQAKVIDVWAIGDGEKIFRYDTDNIEKHSNSVWDGSKITLRGLYNEVLAFQVIVEADSEGAKQVAVSVVPPTEEQSGEVIGSAGEPLYGPGGTIELFSQHYIEVERPTQPLWFYGSEASAPEKMTGWIPDALIPPDARQGKGGMPLDIPETAKRIFRSQDKLKITPAAARQNQGFWIDLHLPRNRVRYPAGTYRGSVEILEAGAQVASIPLEVELLPAYLPDKNHSNIWLYGSNSVVEMYFPDKTPEEIERMMKFEAHRHRIDYAGGNEANTSAFDEKLIADFKPYLDGSAYTPENNYMGPGQGFGDLIFPVGMYGSITNKVMNSEQATREESDKWVNWFTQNAPDAIYFLYLIDEPGKVQYPYIREHAGWVHDNPGPGKALPVFTTRKYTADLKDEIDFWAGHNGVDLQIIPELKTQGKEHWFYNGNRPRYGSVILEAAAIDLRVNGWIKYIHGISTWFLWESTHWYHNFQGPKGHTHQRIFTRPLTFINWKMNFGNGDGIIFYPGKNPFYSDEDRGIDRIIPSIRLKNMRRGQQDYELMYLAEQKVGREPVIQLVRSVVSKSLKAQMSEPVSWSEHGSDYDKIRVKLLDYIFQ